MRRLPTALLLPLFALVALSCGRSGGKPNVLLIIVDTLRADRLGCYGARAVETPAIDRLARRGVRFDAAFTQAPFTLPSITSILTSLYPYRHQVRNNQTNLDERFTTLAELFHRAGYETGAVVGSTVLEKGRRLTQGFDFYDDDFPEEMEVYDEELRAAGVPLGDRAQRRASDVTAAARDWLKEAGDGPFFLLVHYFDPHSKYDPPPPFKERYDRRPYDGEVAYTDDEIGRLLEGLRSRGLDGNTLVALVGDHGESLGEHNEAEHGFFVYDSTIRIPMIVSMPGVIPGGRVENALVRAIDLFPTVAELAGVAVPADLDGRSLAPLWREAGLDEVPVYSEAFLGYFAYGWSPTRAIRTDRWKLVEAPRRELYDLADDPHETENLYYVRRDESRRLEAVLAKHYEAEENAKPVETTTGDIGEAQRERLEALGYITSSDRSARDAFDDLPDPKDGVKAFVKRQQARHYANRGSVMLKEGNTEQGITTLREAVELDPDNDIVLHLLGAALIVTGAPAEAEPIYRDLVERHPEEVEYRTNLAIALVNGGRTAEAVEQFEQCRRMAPDDERFPRLIAAGKDALRRGVGFQINYKFDFGGGG